jgi:hypothetical protein
MQTKASLNTEYAVQQAEYFSELTNIKIRSKLYATINISEVIAYIELYRSVFFCFGGTESNGKFH